MSAGRSLSRRRLLGLAGGVALAAGVGASIPALARTSEPGQLLRSKAPMPTPFRAPLPVPPVLTPSRNPTYPDADYYEVTDRVGYQEILPGLRTQIWGSNGIFPGPTIASRSGRRTVVRRYNHLPVPSVNHLHGGHTPAASDGFATDLVYPQGTTMSGMSMSDMTMPGMPADPMAKISVGYRDYDYPMSQRATTLWYHDHRMGFTGPAVWRGMAGFHVINDDEEDAAGLPHGDRDIPLMICDRSFAEDGSFQYPALDGTLLKTPGVTSAHMNGVLGDVILVNGAPWPILEVAAARYRFRVLNASNARRYQLALDPPPPGGGGWVQVGSDGGLLDRARAYDSVTVVPAERFDLVVDFSRYLIGDEITVTNQLDTGPTGIVLRFRVARRESDDSRIPGHLSTMEELDPRQASVTRDFTFQNHPTGWTINGLAFDPTRPIASPRLGATEIWRFTSDFHHAVHMHLAQFQVISRDGRAPGPEDVGWKDTVDLLPAQEVAVIARFTDYRGRYVLHCHNLEHEDMAMMATYTVE